MKQTILLWKCLYLFYFSDRRVQTNNLTRATVNAILMHHLDLYEESSVVTHNEGCQILTSFGNFFKRWFDMMVKGLGHIQTWPEKLSLPVIARIVRVIIASCLKIKCLQDKESRIIPSQELVEILCKHINIATGFIMMLFKQNEPIPETHKTKASVGKELLNEMIDKIPEVVSQPLNYKRPIQHIILDEYLSQAKRPGRRDMLNESKFVFYRPLVDHIQDIDALDHDGNTLLLVVASQIHEYSTSDYSPVLLSLDIINFLIDQGAYVYARNNEGKSVIDYLTDFSASHKQDEVAQKTLVKLKNEVPPLQTQAAIKAKGLESVCDIPDGVKRFLDMH